MNELRQNMERNKQRKKDRELEKLAELENRRNKVADEYKYIADSARSNRGINITRNIGTLTMIFAAAAGVGMIALKQPTIVNTFAAVAVIGVAVFSNKKLHRSITEKLASQKFMSAIADKKRHDILVKKTEEITEQDLMLPTYEQIQKEADVMEKNHRKELFNKPNYKTIQRAMTGLAAVATVALGLNYVEKNDHQKIKTDFNRLRDFIGLTTKIPRDEDALKQKAIVPEKPAP